MKKYSIVEILYKDYNKLVNFANSLLRNKNLAEDVVQDVFVQLLTSNSNHLLWIFNTGKGVSYMNKIIAVRCLSKKSQFYKQQVSYIKINSKDKSISEKLFNKIKKNISNFDEYEKNLFLLYYESGMTYKELSMEIGIPKISIYNTVRKVKKQLKDLV